MLLVASWFGAGLTAADRVGAYPATHLTASKSERTLTLHLKDGSSVSFAADFGSGGAGPKEREGDPKPRKGSPLFPFSRVARAGKGRGWRVRLPALGSP